MRRRRSGHTRSITCVNSRSYVSHKRGSNRSPNRSTTIESSARPSSTASARSSSSSGHGSSRKQYSSSSLQVFSNQQLQLLARSFGNGLAIGDQRVRQRAAALAIALLRHDPHRLGDQ